MSETTARPVRLSPGPLPLSVAKTQADRIESILASHQRNGGADMTTREICEAYERMWQVMLFPNQAEGRLASLEAAQRVVCDRENRRKCRVTGQTVKVYFVQAQQVDAFA